MLVASDMPSAVDRAKRALVTLILHLAPKRKPLGKTAYRQRLRAVLRHKKTQAVARRYASDMTRVCKAIVKAKGRAVKG